MILTKQQNAGNPFKITESDVEDAQFAGNKICDDEDDDADIPMRIACPRDVHRTSLLGPSVHVPYCTSIGRPFSVHCSRVDRRLIWTSNGRPKVA